jgi:hypothetical protein
LGRLGHWLLGVALGIATVLASALGLMTAIAVALLVIPLARKSGGLAAVSGLLTGFGALWLVLIVRESSSGGALDSPSFWAAVGLVPLAFGVALVAWILAAARPAPVKPGETPRSVDY